MVVPIILYIDQRTDWRMLLILPLAVQAEIDQTWPARCQIRGLSSQLIAEPSATVLPNKSVSLALNRTQTDTKPGKYAFDLLLQSPTGDRRKTVQGTAIIASTVTIWQVPPVTPPVVPPDATPPWLTDVVNGAIAIHNADLSAHPGLVGGGVVFELVAGVPLSGDRAVIANSAGQAIYADGANPSHIGRVIGITVNAAASGANVAIAPSGELTEVSWNWIPGAVFVGANGFLTQTPPASGFTQAIAAVITPTRIRVQILSPTLRQ